MKKNIELEDSQEKKVSIILNRHTKIGEYMMIPGTKVEVTEQEAAELTKKIKAFAKNVGQFEDKDLIQYNFFQRAVYA